jgi:hypothetical protein
MATFARYVLAASVAGVMGVRTPSAPTVYSEIAAAALALTT